jgi:serine/threonine-protein kinase RsbW
MLPAVTRETSGTGRRLPARRPGADRVLDASYPGAARAVGQARRDLAAALAGVPAADDAVFCLGEVASNAVVHSRSGRPGGKFTVTADVLPGALVVVGVDDDGGPWAGRAADSYPHGLEIAATLAISIRIDGDDDGRTVWVILAWEPS